jgi:hypothetical protein
MDRPWACLECGARQDASGQCQRCRRDDVADLRDEKVRELARDIEDRLAHDREKHLRFLGAGIGMVVVFVLWFVPGYWSLRNTTYALPFFLDQPLLMAGIGLGVIAVLSRGKRKRFPYLGDDLSVQ